MSKSDKLKRKLLSGSPMKWAELVTLLQILGYSALDGRGSRVKFRRGKRVISLHRPHPNPEIKHYMANYVIEQLRSEGDL